MGENSKIEWTDHTFNPWIGCTKVHEGCAHCYAEEQMDSRWGKAKWGPHGTRVLTSEANWKKPLKWNKDAEKAGVRKRVFCASLADVFEDWNGPITTAITPASREKCFHCGTSNAVDVPATGGQRVAFNSHTQSIRGVGRNLDKHPLPEWQWATMADLRSQLFRLIDKTPHIDWLLLTKRPENILRMWPTPISPSNYGSPEQLQRSMLLSRHRHLTREAAKVFRHNVWLGTSISNQKHADIQVAELLKCKDLAQVRFVSCEPLLGPIDLRRLTQPGGNNGQFGPYNAFNFGLNWVIVGGESGREARAMNANWARSLRDQCASAEVSFFFKQWGEWADETRTIDGREWSEFPVVQSQ